nr:dipeptide ABC transporter ATP-binding protein DppD [Trueperaceae bacterium]
AATHQARLEAIPGNVPNPLNLPQGCAFHPRCRFIEKERCTAGVPELENAGGGHMVRCVRHAELDLKQEIVT